VHTNEDLQRVRTQVGDVDYRRAARTNVASFFFFFFFCLFITRVRPC